MLQESEFLDDELMPFWDLWHNLQEKCETLLPGRRAFTPGVIAPIMNRLGIGEFMGPKNFKLIYYGSKLEQITGMQVTGTNYYDLLPTEDHEGTVMFHNAIRKYPCGAFMENRLTTQAGNSYLVRILQLPLCDDATNEARFLAYVAGGKKPLHDVSGSKYAKLKNAWIRRLCYIDIGAGCPKNYIDDYQYYDPSI